MINIPSAQSMRNMSDSPFTPPCSFHNDGKYSDEIVKEVSYVFKTSYVDMLVARIEERARKGKHYTELPFVATNPPNEEAKKKLTLLYYFILRTFTEEGYKVSLIVDEEPPYPILLHIEW